MRLIGRNDAALLAALAVAIFVITAPPVSRTLKYVRDVEDARGIALVPALLILVMVFVVLQVWKRQERRTAAAISAMERDLAAARMNEMHRLLAFGQALARSLDDDAIKAAASSHLPLLVPGRNIWALVHKGVRWEPLVIIGNSAAAARVRCANHAIGDASGPLELNDDLCFPMIVGGTSVGVLGVSSNPPLNDHQRSVLAATAALLGVSVKNAELFGVIHENSVRDSLTGCFNRRHALDVLETELRRSRRSQMAVSVVMFDLDHFKAINDTYGHLCGDAVLAAVGARMKSVLRGSDLKCRYGGEEFLVVLPDTPLAGARRVAETLRRDIADHSVTWNDRAIPITASFGVTASEFGELVATPVLERADRALYGAKQDGRNCVRTEAVYRAELSVEQPPTAA